MYPAVLYLLRSRAAYEAEPEVASLLMCGRADTERTEIPTNRAGRSRSWYVRELAPVYTATRTPLYSPRASNVLVEGVAGRPESNHVGGRSEFRAL